MNTVIKSNNNAHGLVIQKLGTDINISTAMKSASVSQTENPLITENNRLVSLLAKSNDKIAAHQSALKLAFAEGKEAGRDEMEAEIDDDRAASLALLGEGIDTAKTELNKVLKNFEGIALIVAETVLDKIFGDTEARKAALTDLVRHQFQLIGYQSVIALEISRADFPNTNEVAELAAKLSIASNTICVSDVLKPGDCRMRMQLGTLEIGLNHQWDSIRELLTDMALDEIEGNG